MSRRLSSVDTSDMDTLSLLILAIGSLAFLDIAAVHLRGDERSRRNGRIARARR